MRPATIYFFFVESFLPSTKKKIKLWFLGYFFFHKKKSFVEKNAVLGQKHFPHKKKYFCGKFLAVHKKNSFVENREKKNIR